jgi:hypothetical protein
MSSDLILWNVSLFIPFCVSAFQHLAFLQGSPVRIRDVPNIKVHDGGAKHGLRPTLSQETLVTRGICHMKGHALCSLSYFLKHGIRSVITFDTNF